MLLLNLNYFSGWQDLHALESQFGENRDLKIPGRLISSTVILGAEDWAETDVLGGKLSTLRSVLFKRLSAANLKFLALFVNHGIF